MILLRTAFRVCGYKLIVTVIINGEVGVSYDEKFTVQLKKTRRGTFLEEMRKPRSDIYA
jgi:hypothetical protein